nr:MAG TPA: hypothetical protein [Caudoviricetes sp.]
MATSYHLFSFCRYNKYNAVATKSQVLFTFL